MIIGLSGYAGAGKSTVARRLVDQHGYTLLRFAGPLKAMMRCMGLGDREIDGDLKETPHPVLGGRTPRHAMQTLGTEWGRDLMHPDLWVNVAIASAQSVLDLGGQVVIDDARFPNEAQAIAGLGGVIARVTRPGVTAVNSHSSEAQKLPADFLVENDGSMQDLCRKVDALASHLRSLVGH